MQLGMLEIRRELSHCKTKNIYKSATYETIFNCHVISDLKIE